MTNPEPNATAPPGARLQDNRPAGYPDLASLYDACGAPVFRLALRLSQSHQEAEDLCHDVFLRYWQQGRYDPRRGAVLAYLLREGRQRGCQRGLAATGEPAHTDQTGRWGRQVG